MAKLVKITGMKNILRNMKKANVDLGKRVERGLLKGGLFLQRKSQQVVPVDKDVLKPSADTRNVGGKGFKTDVVVSYNTEYDVYVHEDMEAKHKKGKQAKFLEGPAREKINEIFKIVAKG